MKKRTKKDVILEHFRKIDPKLVDILKEIDWNEWFGEEDLDSRLLFRSICRTIIGQQLAGKAAEAIFKRFEDLLEGNIFPEDILEIDDQQIRNVGLSWAKVRSVKDLSIKVTNKDLVLENLKDMENEELIVELSKVKGIGRWTAEMILMFHLGREDIFSWGDLGLKNGLKKFLGNPEVTLSEMESIVDKWSPFKTCGAIAMWHLLDNR